jgi:WD40 repeat protein
LWDVASGKNLGTLRAHGDRVSCVVLSRNGKTLASVSQDSVQLWDLATGRNTAAYRRRVSGTCFAGVRSLALSPDGAALALAEGHQAKLLDLETERERVLIEVDPELARLWVTYDTDGKFLVFHYRVGPGFSLTLWDGVTSKKTVTFQDPSPYLDCVAVSPDGKTLAAGGIDETITRWTLTTGKRTASHKQPGQITCMAFSPDGTTLALGYKEDRSNKAGPIRLIDVATGKERATLKGHTGTLCCVAFSPDGRTLASASLDRTIKLWDLQGVRNP